MVDDAAPQLPKHQYEAKLARLEVQLYLDNAVAGETVEPGCERARSPTNGACRVRPTAVECPAGERAAAPVAGASVYVDMMDVLFHYEALAAEAHDEGAAPKLRTNGAATVGWPRASFRARTCRR